MPQISAVYSSGAMRDAAARRNASVIAYWPIAPVTPSTPSTRQCASWIGVQSRYASAPANTLVISSIQNTMACVVSLRPSTRTAMADTA